MKLSRFNQLTGNACFKRQLAIALVGGQDILIPAYLPIAKIIGGLIKEVVSETFYRGRSKEFISLVKVPKWRVIRPCICGFSNLMNKNFCNCTDSDKQDFSKAIMLEVLGFSIIGNFVDSPKLADLLNFEDDFERYTKNIRVGFLAFRKDNRQWFELLREIFEKNDTRPLFEQAYKTVGFSMKQIIDMMGVFKAITALDGLNTVTVKALQEAISLVDYNKYPIVKVVSKYPVEVELPLTFDGGEESIRLQIKSILRSKKNVNLMVLKIREVLGEANPPKNENLKFGDDSKGTKGGGSSDKVIEDVNADKEDKGKVKGKKVIS